MRSGTLPENSNAAVQLPSLFTWLSSGLLPCVVWHKLADVFEVTVASIIRAIEASINVLITVAANTSETSANV
jgi:dolichyl-phosphate-mannose--protein O-mannosyl transferase